MTSYNLEISISLGMAGIFLTSTLVLCLQNILCKRLIKRMQKEEKHFGQRIAQLQTDLRQAIENSGKDALAGEQNLQEALTLGFSVLSEAIKQTSSRKLSVLKKPDDAPPKAPLTVNQISSAEKKLSEGNLDSHKTNRKSFRPSVSTNAVYDEVHYSTHV